MELGDEVSLKIKSAIRARLKELGIVWDRELPDYVMVLIANKKSKEQMEKDLTIFLGSHTAGFTAWLHNVLKKLEECAINRGLSKKKDEEKKTKSKRRTCDENHQEAKKLKGIDKIGDASDSGSESATPNHLSPVAIDEGVDSDVSDFSVPTLALSDMKLSSLVNHSNGIEKLNTNNIEKKGPEGCVPEGKCEKEVTSREVERSKPKERIEISWSGETSMERLGRSTQRLTKRSSSKVKERTLSRSRSKGDGLDQGDHLKRKEPARGYCSSRTSVFKRSSCREGVVNGYGNRIQGKDRRLRPRSGSRESEREKLPSLVKTIPRPTRDPLLQPPSNLILRAVAEAQRSIATSSLPQPIEKVEKKEKSRMTRKAVYRKKNIPVFQRENISVTLLNDRVIADKIREEDGDSLIFENKIKMRQDERQSIEREVVPEVERFTISLASDDDSLAASDFEDVNDEKILTEENYINCEAEPTIEPMDISSTTIVDEKMVDVGDFGGQRFDRRRLGPRVVPDADTVLSCLAPVEDFLTKTIVNENVNGGPAEGKTDENGKVIKCKFWPSCEAGNDCRFYHPKEYCRTLPNCKFGQKCLYYHPPCKFADKCLNVTCPYAHIPVPAPAVKGKAWTKVPLAPSNGQMCMYYPNCKNAFCPYQHGYSLSAPMRCKFGINCMNGSCEWDHSQSNKNPYKWVNHNAE